ncbi:ATP-binding cassette domain-containing protein, partial [Roseovarius mucosus]|uniref:ATP-binding cassette domain-containing protein n=1 Tax=Roseovarius mucosus TaxID=215743 RepID=UPI003F6F53E7
NVVLGTQPLWGAKLDMGAARAKLVGLAQEFGLAVNPDARLGSLSVGERQRVEILKALYRDARILILDEPTAVLTPQQADALFAALRKMVAQGLSIIFISHKLHEVMAIASRVVVLRHGKQVGEVAVRDTDPRALAEMMVGSAITQPELRAATPGPALLELRKVVTPDRGTMRGLRGVDLALRAGTITGLAGVSGNGQAALADLIAGLERPSTGEMLLHGAAPAQWSVAEALGAGIARIPEDRHKTGTIADFTLT